MTTAETLAEQLSVSPRTVYRDIRRLEAAGVPVKGEAGVGYALQRDFELPPLTFTHDEIEALVLGTRMVQSWTDEELATAAQQVIEKVERVLPGPLRQVLDNTALFAPATRWAGARGAEIGLFRQAIGLSQKLLIQYARADGAESERIIRPLGLYFWGNKWSLAAWCELRESYRSFRPDRVIRVERLRESFDGSDGITLEACVEAMRKDWDD